MLRNKSRKRVVALRRTHRDTERRSCHLPTHAGPIRPFFECCDDLCRRVRFSDHMARDPLLQAVQADPRQARRPSRCARNVVRYPQTNEVKQEGPSETAAAPIDSKGLSSQSHLLPFSVLARAFGHGDGSYRFLAAPAERQIPCHEEAATIDSFALCLLCVSRSADHERRTPSITLIACDRKKCSLHSSPPPPACFCRPTVPASARLRP
jgi:hypothetical protein